MGRPLRTRRGARIVGRDEQDVLAVSIAQTISDYRAGEVPAPTPQHVMRWVAQFDEAVRIPLLRELDHVLERTYLARSAVESFLGQLLRYEPLTGADPSAYWPDVRFLAVQNVGRSQHEMLEMFGAVMEGELAFGLNQCGANPAAFVYLDDGVFSGNRLLADLSSWVTTEAPESATVHIVCMALHLGGQWYAKERIASAAQQAGKRIDLHWWAGVKVENRRSEIRVSDVLRPTALPDDQRVRDYAAQLQYPVELRSGSEVGRRAFFSSGEGRHLLEQELLKAGVHVRDMCPFLNDYQRPLGNWVLETLGFGTMMVTFRNCPNNAPLALWAGDPWYPLFPRRTNP